MEEQIEFRFPILTIKKVNPILFKDEKVFAYEVKARTETGINITFYENKGLDLSGYLGKKMECFLEITKGKFDDIGRDEKQFTNAFTCQYQWQKRLYEYFPNLVRIRDSLDIANSEDEQSVQELFEITADKCFREWGLNGLNIGVYQDKPLLKSPDGFFLLNEYQFEEELEGLELDREVYIKIDEAFLRGIRPCEVLQPYNQKQRFTLPEQSPVPVQPEQRDESKKLIQQEEPKEPKRRKFLFD